MGSESFHWYTDTGAEMHQLIGKNGKLRKTTLRDARELNLFPSVTTVMGILGKPSLQAWFEANIANIAFTIRPGETESKEDYSKRIRRLAKESTAKAADEGTRIHSILERGFQKGTLDESEQPYYDAVAHELNLVFGFQSWVTELAVVSKYYGYAGKIDLHSNDWVVDFKTKDGDLSNAKCYEDHYSQLAAYRHGLGIKARCANVFISRDHFDDLGHPLVKTIIHDDDKSDAGMKRFLVALNAWQTIKNYKPQ